MAAGGSMSFLVTASRPISYSVDQSQLRKLLHFDPIGEVL